MTNPMSLHRKTLEQFVKLALQQLKGKWVILGGAIIPLLEDSYRVTVNIDVAEWGKGSNASTMALFSIAEQMGLPVETINPAAAYFFKKVEDWQ
jgi:hypothetical protein